MENRSDRSPPNAGPALMGFEKVKGVQDGAMAARQIISVLRKTRKFARLGGNVEAFVPPSVARALREKFRT